MFIESEILCTVLEIKKEKKKPSEFIFKNYTKYRSYSTCSYVSRGTTVLSSAQVCFHAPLEDVCYNIIFTSESLK